MSEQPPQNPEETEEKIPVLGRIRPRGFDPRFGEKRPQDREDPEIQKAKILEFREKVAAAADNPESEKEPGDRIRSNKEAERLQYESDLREVNENLHSYARKARAGKAPDAMKRLNPFADQTGMPPVSRFERYFETITNPLARIEGAMGRGMKNARKGIAKYFYERGMYSSPKLETDEMKELERMVKTGEAEFLWERDIPDVKVMNPSNEKDKKEKEKIGLTKLNGILKYLEDLEDKLDHHTTFEDVMDYIKKNKEKLRGAERGRAEMAYEHFEHLEEEGEFEHETTLEEMVQHVEQEKEGEEKEEEKEKKKKGYNPDMEFYGRLKQAHRNATNKYKGDYSRLVAVYDDKGKPTGKMRTYRIFKTADKSRRDKPFDDIINP